MINGIEYQIGSAQFMGVDNTQTQAVYLAKGGELLAQFTLVDAIREDAVDTINTLKKNGYEISIASGDSSIHVDQIAKKIAVSNVYKGLKPEDKLTLIHTLQTQYSIAMFGDGINDAPVLAGANLSVAMGSGSAVTKTVPILFYLVINYHVSMMQYTWQN